MKLKKQNKLFWKKGLVSIGKYTLIMDKKILDKFYCIDFWLYQDDISGVYLTIPKDLLEIPPQKMNLILSEDNNKKRGKK